MNVEVDCYVRLIFAGVGRRPRHMGHTMVVVYGGEADVPYPHVLRPQRPIARIDLERVHSSEGLGGISYLASGNLIAQLGKAGAYLPDRNQRQRRAGQPAREQWLPFAKRD